MTRRLSRNPLVPGGRVRAGILGSLLAAALAMSATSGRAAADAGGPGGGGASGEVVVLPPLEVEAPTTARPWQYAAVADVEVLSRCSVSTTRGLLEASWRLEQLLRLLVPDELQAKLAKPRTIILTDQKTTPTSAKDLIGDRPTNNPRPARRGRAGASVVHFMPNLMLHDIDAVAVYAIIDEGTFSGRNITLASDYVQFRLEYRTPSLPRWFVAGVMRLMPHVSFLDASIEFDAFDWISPAETSRLRLDPEAPRTLLSARELFAGRGSRDAGESDEVVQLWRAQSALLVRWAMDGDDPARRAAFWKLVARSAVEPVTEAMVQECLGLGFADLRDRLSDYLPEAVSEHLRLGVDKLAPLPSVKLRPATAGETGRLKGDWERMEIGYVKARHPEFADRYALQAHSTLAEATERGSRDPQLLGVIGLYEIDVGNDAGARAYLEAAAREKVVGPRIYLELTRLRYAEARANPRGGNKMLTAEQANTVLAPLGIAWKQAPPLPETYLLAADVWLHMAGVPKRPQFALLEEGLNLFPSHPGLIYGLATLNLLHGSKPEAAAWVARGLQASSTPEARARFAKLADALAAGRDPPPVSP